MAEDITVEAPGSHDFEHEKKLSHSGGKLNLQGSAGFAQTRAEWDALCTKVKDRWFTVNTFPPTWTKDTDFTPSSTSIGSGSLASISTSAVWESLTALKSGSGCGTTCCLYHNYAAKFSLFGNKGHAHPDDVNQGSVGDCYFLATVSSLAEWPARIEKVFANANPANFATTGVYFYVGGKKTLYDVDDDIPLRIYYNSGGKNYCGFWFASPRADGAVWPELLEKAFAKAAGNYDQIASGNFGPAIRFLTGVPYKRWSTDADAASVIFNTLKSGDQNQFPMACATSGGSNSQTNTLGLVLGHQYSVIGVYTVTKTDGSTMDLIKCRNPWGKTTYVGPWHNTDPNWSSVSSAEQTRIGQSSIVGTGQFFMTPSDFKAGFSVYSVAYYHDSYHFTDAEYNPHPSLELSCHKMSTSAGFHGYVGIDTVSDRMLGSHCTQQYNTLSVTAYKDVSGSLQKVATATQGYIDSNFAFSELGSSSAANWVVLSRAVVSTEYNKAGVNVYANEAVTLSTCDATAEINAIIASIPLNRWGAVNYAISNVDPGLYSFAFESAYSSYLATVTLMVTKKPVSGDTSMCTEVVAGQQWQCICKVKGVSPSQKCSFVTPSNIGYSIG